ncbi:MULTISPECIES: PRC-barrel domain-containing protein [Roseobacteraceae]|uniref:PRC-barrel domain protein n=1 Tax=Pseudosulfitobacter pseudonitzschiae TaxID=1402135 RepID=A0A221JXA8_9RHOB|nr:MULTISPECIES: PRC-barrel domain-containing protein [Roseobacteraceae]ASM71323.1 PRC-barrel domain protein [Pseudosulfitobacter pseudonitzschiae]
MKPFTLIFCCAALAAPAIAQDAEVGTAGPVNTRDDTYLMSADDIDVLSGTGEKIGEIEEILVDANGVPAGFLIEFQGFNLFEDDDVAVPIEALEYDGRAYVSKMTQEQLAALRPWDE